MFGHVRRLLSILILGLLGQGLSLSQSTGPAPIRVLVITGGHSFDPSFFELFEGYTDVQWEHRKHAGETSDAYSAPIAESWDVVVLYDMVQLITKPQKQNFLELFDKGKGLVVLHHALASYQDWPLFEEIIGGRFRSPPAPELPTGVRLESDRLIVEFSDIAELPDRLAGVARTAKDYFDKRKDAPPPSTFEHDVSFSLKVVDSTHPVLAGVQSFAVVDEIYGRVTVRDDISPLLVTDHPRNTPVVAWAKTFKNSRIVTMQLAHGPAVYQNPEYRRLVINAIRWTAHR